MSSAPLGLLWRVPVIDRSLLSQLFDQVGNDLNSTNTIGMQLHAIPILTSPMLDRICQISDESIKLFKIHIPRRIHRQGVPGYVLLYCVRSDHLHAIDDTYNREYACPILVNRFSGSGFLRHTLSQRGRLRTGRLSS
jgi:hypothetical protein